jgi:hypothetical protein
VDLAKIYKNEHPTRGYKYHGDISNPIISKYIPQFLAYLWQGFWSKVLEYSSIKV